MTETVNHLACAYAMLLLHDEGLPIDAKKISEVIAKAGIPNIEGFYAKLYANNVTAASLAATVANGAIFGSASTGAAAPAAAAVAEKPAAVAVAPKEEEKVAEEDFDMGDLFG